MGANTRNRYGITRRFGICYMLADDPQYRALLEAYQVTGDRIARAWNRANSRKAG